MELSVVLSKILIQQNQNIANKKNHQKKNQISKQIHQKKERVMGTFKFSNQSKHSLSSLLVMQI
jgi:hypothetical protein